MEVNTYAENIVSSIVWALDSVYAAGSTAEGSKGSSEDVRQAIFNDPEVESVNIRGSQTVVAANEDSEAFQTGGGSSSLAPFYPEQDYVGEAARMSEGNAPSGDSEVVINQEAVDEYDIAIGDTLILVTPNEHIQVDVSGVYEPPVDSGSSIALMMSENGYLDRFAPGGMVDSLAVSGASDVEPDALVQHLNDEYD